MSRMELEAETPAALLDIRAKALAAAAVAIRWDYFDRATFGSAIEVAERYLLTGVTRDPR